VQAMGGTLPLKGCSCCVAHAREAVVRSRAAVSEVPECW
jgi:hypothetical protein